MSSFDHSVTCTGICQGTSCECIPAGCYVCLYSFLLHSVNRNVSLGSSSCNLYRSDDTTCAAIQSFDCVCEKRKQPLVGHSWVLGVFIGGVGHRAVTWDSCLQRSRRTESKRQCWGRTMGLSMQRPPLTGFQFPCLLFGVVFCFFVFPAWISRWLTRLIHALWRVAAHDGEWAAN